MSRYLRKLSQLLGEAQQQGLLDAAAAGKLLEMAEDRERSGGVLSLAGVLGWMGAVVLGLGVILIISANWDEISATVKLLGFFALFGGVQFGGVWLLRQGRLPWAAESLGFLGALLFLGGIGLISQIYQVEGRPPQTVLIWLVGIAPLAWCYRSASMTLLSLFALTLWLHMEQFSWSQRYYDVSPATCLVVELGLGVAALGLAALLREREPTIAWALRGAGVLLLFGGLYLLGFYRHMTEGGDTAWESAAPPAAALVAGVAGMAIGYRKMLPDNPYLRDRLVILLSLTLFFGTVVLLAELGGIPRGPELKFFDFGWYRTFHVLDWLLSIAVWVLWFALALWCVFFAARTGRRAYLNTGVVAVGLGVITRFLDLIGGLLETGLTFVVGGAILLATCFAIEYWRRTILQRLKSSDRPPLGA